MKLICSTYPLHILKPVFSLNQFHLFLDKELELFLLLSFLLTFFFFVSIFEDSIDIVLLIFMHVFSHSYLVRLSLYILLFLLLQSYLLFFMENRLSLVSLSSRLKDLVFFRLFNFFSIFENL